VLPGFENLIVARAGAGGRITLDRPKKMNALTYGMVRDMSAVLAAWERDETVRFVVIDGAGAAGLCAGGDIREVYESSLAADGAAPRFWADEYRLDATIAGYPKPIVAIMHGTVMGGGVGISAHASHRIVTDSTALAMPEARIGFIPDVGGTWLLSRAPGETGTYLALTGDRIGAADAVALGLADRYVPQASLAAFVDALELCEASDVRGIDAAIEAFAAKPPDGALDAVRATIDRVFAASTVEEIVASLERDASPFAAAALATLTPNSPTSLKLTLRALRDARTLRDVRACLAMEYRIMCRLYGSHDTVEGVRAAVVDKDRRPRWDPSTLADVPEAALDRSFASLGARELAFDGTPATVATVNAE
jgi:enoyl-CoA hydratase